MFFKKKNSKKSYNKNYLFEPIILFVVATIGFLINPIWSLIEIFMTDKAEKFDNRLRKDVK